MASVLLATFTLLLAMTLSAALPADVIYTTLGPIRGYRETVRDRAVDVYYGIPFARPPVGELRFKRPMPAEPWTEVKETITKPNSCFQSKDMSFERFEGVEMWNPNTPMSEDCLYLNLWVPRGFGSQEPRATLVWIFGGGFWAGTSTLDVYNGSMLAATENVVVVSMNYRLGPLGFLYMGTEDAPGNQGLWDQRLALMWIDQNLSNFGGRRETVTLFGESAGAMSIGLHLVSPRSMNYFSRAILQSGSPTADYLVGSRSEAAKRSKKLGDFLNCTDQHALVSCLRDADAQRLTDMQWSLTSRYFELPLFPVVDGNFLPDYPSKLVAEEAVKNTQILLGANKNEGMFWLVYAYKPQFPYDNAGRLNRTEFLKILPGITGEHPDEKQFNVTVYEYVDSVVPALRDYRYIADQISGDLLFTCPVVNFGKQYNALRPSHDVYMYSFEHNLSSNPWPRWMGVLHGYEIEVMFGLPLNFSYTEEEHKMAARVTGYITRFAQSGDPNPLGNTTTWPKMTAEGLEYLKLTAEKDTVEHGLRRRACTYREQLFPLLERDPTTNRPACQTLSGSLKTADLSYTLHVFTILLSLLLLPVS